VSLTSLLKDTHGPLWEWFEANFPETRSFGTAANRELRGGSTKEPCVVPPVPGTDHSLVGTAVGYLLSAHLRPGALDHAAATNAAGQLDARLRRQQLRPTSIERRVVARVDELRPWESELDDDAWTELCGLAGTLGRFEQYFRARERVLPYLAGPLRDHRGDLAELAGALVPEPTLRDIEGLGRATIEDQIHIRDASDLHIGPTFAQNFALGGADADIIYDGVLIDLKSTGAARVVGRRELWQLLGYLLADTDDQYKVSGVGFAALRRRRSAFWPAQGFVRALSGGNPATVEEWRQDFAVALEPLAQRQAESARARRSPVPLKPAPPATWRKRASRALRRRFLRRT
jgi:hypothetical protein